VRAPAGSALAEQRLALPTGMRVVELRFATALIGAVDVPQGAPVARVELHDPTDRIVGTAELQAGRDSMEWASDDASVQPYVQHQRVEVAGYASEGTTEPRPRLVSFADLAFDTPVPASSMVIRAVPPSGEFALFGGAVVGADGSSVQLFGRTKAKYRQIFVDDEIRVLEDTTALPRAFIVPLARVSPSLGAALSEMIHQPFQPDQEVMLASDAAPELAGVATERGGQGSATITDYAADNVKIRASTSDDAWLVLSDTYYP